MSVFTEYNIVIMNVSKTKIENILRDFYIVYNPAEEMYKYDEC